MRAGIVNVALASVIAMALLTGAASAAGSGRPIRILAFGDSLTAGFGLAPREAFPVQLEAALKAKGHAVEVVNAGVSGDTTAAALERLDWAISGEIDAVIVELGANDALRGQAPAQARTNLAEIVKRLKARGAEVLIAGMSAPRNWGPEYTAAFDRIFPDLAAEQGALLYPFFLDGVALRQELNLNDGMHPNARGIAVIVERMLPTVERLLARVAARRAAAKG